MKLSAILVAGLGMTPLASACLHAYGHMVSLGGGHYESVEIEVVDNGAMVCKSFGSGWGHRVDNDGHITLQCRSGYIFATDGITAWYRNPATAFQIALRPSIRNTCTVAQGGACYKPRYDFDQRYFGC